MDDGLTGAVGASVNAAVVAAAATGAAGHAHGVASANCLNCGQELAPHANFCSACGQDTANHPPTLMEFIHEFVDHYVAAEGKLWKSLGGLIAKPGFLTVEYLAGRKSRYVLPLRLLLTLGLAFFLALKLVPSASETLGLETISKHTPKGHGAASAPAAASSANAADEDDNNDVVAIGLPESWKKQLPPSLAHKIDQANTSIRKDPEAYIHRVGSAVLGLAPYVVLGSLPFFAAILKLLFWRQTYGTHFVFAMHLHAAWYFMLILVVVLPWSLSVFGVWLWSNLYPILALKRVHQASWLTTLLRSVVLAGLHWILITLALMTLLIAGLLSAA